MTSPGDSQPPKDWWLENACRIAAFLCVETLAILKAREGSVLKTSRPKGWFHMGLANMMSNFFEAGAFILELQVAHGVAAHHLALHVVNDPIHARDGIGACVRLQIEPERHLGEWSGLEDDFRTFLAA